MAVAVAVVVVDTVVAVDAMVADAIKDSIELEDELSKPR